MLTVAVRPGSGRGIACAVAPTWANSGEKAVTVMPRSITQTTASSAKRPSPAATFSTTVSMPSSISRTTLSLSAV